MTSINEPVYTPEFKTSKIAKDGKSSDSILDMAMADYSGTRGSGEVSIS
jgi:hypothetical protein